MLLPGIRYRENIPSEPVATEPPALQVTPEPPTTAPQTTTAPQQERAQEITQAPRIPEQPVIPEPPQERIPEQTPVPSTPPVSPPVERPAETLNRSIYFLQARDDMDLVMARAERTFRTASSSPLHDSLNALLAGPTAEEINRGFMHFIPPDTRIISVQISEHTAYINLNDEFQYSIHGREGYDAQIKQIVWTATEFPNIHAVQLLIEGRRVDFLSEGVRIWNPISR